MRLNTDRALDLGRRLYFAYGCNWQAVRDAGRMRPDGVIEVVWPSPAENTLSGRPLSGEDGLVRDDSNPHPHTRGGNQ